MAFHQEQQASAEAGIRDLVADVPKEFYLVDEDRVDKVISLMDYINSASDYLMQRQSHQVVRRMAKQVRPHVCAQDAFLDPLCGSAVKNFLSYNFRTQTDIGHST